MPGRWSQRHRPSGQLIRSEVPAVAAVFKAGSTIPHDSTIKRLGDKIRIGSGGSTGIATPTAADGGAAEFDVSLSGSGPWDIAVSWIGAGLSVLTRGTYSRTIAVTSAGATNSPLSIPVTLTVL
jgi:hypothetical protein